MALARSFAVALVGLDGHVVEVEADLAQGLPGLAITGLPDASLYEARDRVRAAVVNSGFTWPNKRMTLGLSPAWLPKRGTGFDLALAMALLAAAEVVPLSRLDGLLFVGELGLDGRVKPVSGILPSVVTWAKAGHNRVVVPADNLAEARLLPGTEAVGVETLAELVGWLNGAVLPEPHPVASALRAFELPGDFAEVAGQVEGRFACEMAAAGGHNLLLKGTPGCALPGTAPRGDSRRHRRRRIRHCEAGGGLTGSSGRPVSRRGSRVRTVGPGRAAPAVGKWPHLHPPGRRYGHLSRPVRPPSGGKPLSVWAGREPMHLPTGAPQVLPGPAVRTVARPHRHPGPPAPGKP
jgi:hypothetical protein